MEILKTGIVIMEWLRPADPKLGEELYQAIEHKERDEENFFVEYHPVNNRNEFIEVLNNLISNTPIGTIFTLHIVAHGCEAGIGTSIKDFICWKEFFNYTRQLNILMENTLLIVLSSCVGGGILSYIDPEQRAPYMAFIANTRSVLIEDARKGFPLFYSNYHNPLDFKPALDRLNQSIDFTEEVEPGVKKTEFFIMSASHSFDEIFNPDRDAAHFDSIIDRLLPPNPSIPQELRREKAKELFVRRGAELKPYFTFKV